MELIGLIAGNGSFPLLFAREARRRGYRVAAVAHRGETDPSLAAEVESLVWVRAGQIGRVIKALKHAGVREAVMAGGIDKVRSLASLRPDLRALKLLAGAGRHGDDALLRGFAEELEREGVKVVSSTAFLDEMLAAAGLIAGSVPSSVSLKDLRLGCAVLADLGRHDVGQGVVVEGGLVLAIEAIEGTDAMIRRAGELGRGSSVVVKMAKSGQDMRFDMPAVGPETVRVMAVSGAAVLAVEAARTLILEAETLVAEAERLGVSVVGCDHRGEVEGV